MVSASDGEWWSLAKAGVDEGEKSNDKHTNLMSECEVGHGCLTSTQMRRRRKRATAACPQRGQMWGILYARNVDTTSMLRKDG